MERLIKKIKREIKRSPAKSVVLGSLVVVAVAIWGSKLAATPSPVVQENSMSAIPSNPLDKAPGAILAQEMKTNRTATDGDLELGPWRVLHAWRAQPFDEPALERDPFAMDVAVTGQSSDVPSAELATSPPSPEDLGIHLTGIVIAGHDRLAILENDPVHAGSTLKIERDGRSYFVKILDVTPTGIKLNIDGVDFERFLPDLGLSSGAGNGP